MSSPDIYLGPGDTFPVTRLTLRGPNLEDGSPGDPIDLTTAVQLIFRYQLRAASELPVNRVMTLDGAATLGKVKLDWLTTGGGIPSGDYNARAVVTFADGHVETFPQLRPGDDPLNEFFWLHVGASFITIPGAVSLQVLSTDLASLAPGLGASMVGVEDAQGLITATNVEAALEELATLRVDLASTALAKGAALVSINDAGGHVTATTVEGAIAELAVAIGTIASVTDPDLAILAATTAGNGASRVAIQDAGNLITATTVEGALAEIATNVATNTTSITANTTAIALRPLTTDLAAVTAAKGASLIGIQDAAAIIAATTVEGALAELATSIAANTTAIALRPLTTDLAAVTAAKGASLVGIQDAGSLIVATTVEAAFAELATNIATNTSAITLRPLTTDLAALTVGKGAAMIGLQDVGAYYATKNVEFALQQAGVAGTATIPLTRGGTGQITAGASFDALTISAPSLTSAATVDLSLAGCPGHYAIVNGATGPITSFGTAPAGTERILRFASTPTIAYNLTSLILPGAADIIAAAGDVIFLHSLGSGNWRCTSYLRAAAAPWNGDASALTLGTLPLTRGGTGQATANAALGALQTLTSAQVSLLALADAGTNTAPELFTLKHTTSGTPAAGFGVLSAVDLHSSANVVRRAMTDVTTWTSPTDTAEASQRIISLMLGGALQKVGGFGFNSSTYPMLYLGDPGSNDGFRRVAAGSRIDLMVAGSAYWAFALTTECFGHVLIDGNTTSTGNLTGAATTFQVKAAVKNAFLFAPTAPGSNNTASTEAVGVDFSLGRTSTWATGALTTQREFLIRKPTYNFVAASTLTTAATLAIEGAPVAGGFATITTPLALWVQNGLSRLDISDATLVTADVLTLRHATSGTVLAASPLGATMVVELPSTVLTNFRRAMTDVTKWATATDTAEIAVRTIQLMNAGSLVDVATFGGATNGLTVTSPNTGALTPVLSVVSSSATGQVGIQFLTGSTPTLRGGIRADYVGNLNWFSKGGAHYFLTGGDSGGGGGTVAMQINSTADVQIVGKSGFNNTAPIAKPTVTGSRGANAALASLLTALANYGLVVDSSS